MSALEIAACVFHEAKQVIFVFYLLQVYRVVPDVAVFDLFKHRIPNGNMRCFVIVDFSGFNPVIMP